MVRKELAGGASADLAHLSEEVIYKIDIPANRYDMLCLEGISQALNVFRGTAPPPRLRVVPGPERLVIRPETALVRPFCVAAVLRGVTFDAARYASFIDLQDKLHANLCRNRSLVAIGTHDLATVEGPFEYRAEPGEDIVFVPLKKDREFNAKELLEHYKKEDLKLRKFVPLIEDSIVFPVVRDAEGRVLSLPPIINGARSAISLATRDVLIECTATDPTKARVVLGVLCAAFAGYCADPFVVESVQVVDAFGQTHVTPKLEPRELVCTLDELNGATGLSLDAHEAAGLLRRMLLDADVEDEGAEAPDRGPVLRVRAPPTRSDVLHARDVAEDLAIAVGYDNVPARIARALPSRENPVNALSELVRGAAAAHGLSEILTWALGPRKEAFDNLRLSRDEDAVVSVGNPATVEFEVARRSLLPGALKTLGANKDAPLPLRLFEVGDVLLRDDASPSGSRNDRRLVAVHCDKTAAFEVAHGLLQAFLRDLRSPWLATEQARADAEKTLRRARPGETEAQLAAPPPAGELAPASLGHWWRQAENPTFFPGRHAEVVVPGGRVVARFGSIHPETLEAFDIQCPVSALEIELEAFCFDQFSKALQTQAHLAPFPEGDD